MNWYTHLFGQFSNYLLRWQCLLCKQVWTMHTSGYSKALNTQLVCVLRTARNEEIISIINCSVDNKWSVLAYVMVYECIFQCEKLATAYSVCGCCQTSYHTFLLGFTIEMICIIFGCENLESRIRKEKPAGKKVGSVCQLKWYDGKLMELIFFIYWAIFLNGAPALSLILTVRNRNRNFAQFVDEYFFSIFDGPDTVKQVRLPWVETWNMHFHSGQCQSNLLSRMYISLGKRRETVYKPIVQ